jgi:hypothetical protein
MEPRLVKSQGVSLGFIRAILVSNGQEISKPRLEHPDVEGSAAKRRIK